MDLRYLGNSGLRVSAVGLGCNNFGRNVDRETARAVIHKALDMGITLFDTGDMYGHRGGSETIMGEVLGARRKDIVLATKFGWPMDDEGKLQGGSRRYIMSAVEASLKRLKTDWIDLYQSHKPDPLTPIEETLRALDDLVQQGKVRSIGTQPHASWQVLDARQTARAHGLTALATCEDEYSLLVRGIERDLIPAMQASGIAPPALLSARERTSHRQVQARRAAAGRIALRSGQGARLYRPVPDRGELAEARRTHRVCAAARADAPRPRNVLDRGAPAGRERHRRRDQARAGRGECEGRRNEVDGSGHGGTGSNDRVGGRSQTSSLAQ